MNALRLFAGCGLLACLLPGSATAQERPSIADLESRIAVLEQNADPQIPTVRLARQTIGSTPRPLLLTDGTGGEVQLALGEALAFDLLVIGLRVSPASPATSADYRRQGFAYCNGSPGAMVLTVGWISQPQSSDPVGWDITIDRIDSTCTLRVIATGATGQTVNWSARLSMVRTTN
jgi:hypothetical protein